MTDREILHFSKIVRARQVRNKDDGEDVEEGMQATTRYPRIVNILKAIQNRSRWRDDRVHDSLLRNDDHRII